MIARSRGGPMEAICLSRLSPHKSAYTTSSQTCNAWASGEIGAIDSPGFDGTEYEQEGRVEMSDEPKPTLPPGDYAIVELFGHTTLIGRVAEIERFGAKMLAIEPLFRDTLLPVVLHGGAAIYRFTAVPAETAYARQPRKAWEIPPAIRAIVPPLLLAASPIAETFDAVVAADEDDEGPF